MGAALESCAGQRERSPGGPRQHQAPWQDDAAAAPERPLSERARRANAQFLRQGSGGACSAALAYEPQRAPSAVWRGKAVEVRGAAGWTPGLVVAVARAHIRVHFPGHSAKYDALVPWEDLSSSVRARRARLPALCAVPLRLPPPRAAADAVADADAEQRRSQPVCLVCLERGGPYRETRSCSRGHATCEGCLGDYARLALGDLSRCPLRCPGGCGELVEQAALETVLAPDELERLERRTAQAAIQSAGVDLVTCPACGAALAREGEVPAPDLVCGECAAPLGGAVPALDHDAALDRFGARQGLQRCPACKTWIERADGCQHMTHTAAQGCKRSSCDFCFICGLELLPDGLHDVRGEVHFQTEEGVFGRCTALAAR